MVINVKETPKTVSVGVPDSTENIWIERFEQYPFIKQVLLIMICFD
jgi:hypothetical protein